MPPESMPCASASATASAQGSPSQDSTRATMSASLLAARNASSSARNQPERSRRPSRLRIRSRRADLERRPDQQQRSLHRRMGDENPGIAAHRRRQHSAFPWQPVALEVPLAGHQPIVGVEVHQRAGRLVVAQEVLEAHLGPRQRPRGPAGGRVRRRSDTHRRSAGRLRAGRCRCSPQSTRPGDGRCSSSGNGRRRRLRARPAPGAPTSWAGAGRSSRVAGLTSGFTTSAPPPAGQLTMSWTGGGWSSRRRPARGARPGTCAGRGAAWRRRRRRPQG